MGRKYRALKEALKLNPVRSLVWVDDTKLRLKIYQQAELTLKRIEKLEKKIANFYTQDQRLYENWFDLTFREQIAYLETLQQKNKNLGRFHNRLLAWAQKEGCETYEVYQRLVDLEARLLACDEVERAQIEKFYLELDQFAEIKMKEELAEDMFGSGFPFDEEDEDEDVDRENDIEYQQLQKIQKWDDHKIKKALADSKSGYEFLNEAIYLGTQYFNPQFIVRVWDLAPKALQVRMAKQFSKDTGASLNSMIDDFRFAAENLDNLHEDDDDDDGSDDYDDENNESDFSYAGQKKCKPADLDLEDEKRLKLLYRQLARKIHPDTQVLSLEAKDQNWMKPTWERLQKAYKEKNLREMEKLYGLTLLRLKDLRGLSFSEMKQCQEWLLEDFKSIEKQSKHLANMPAWGFSTKKIFTSLIKKNEKEIETACAEIKAHIDEMTEFHNYLKQMSKTSRPLLKKKSRRKKKKTKMHLKTQNDERQRSFFE